MVDERRYDSCGNTRSLIARPYKSCFSNGDSDEDYEGLHGVLLKEVGMPSIDCCESKREASPLVVALRRLGSCLESVEAGMDNLRTRLSPVMGPPNSPSVTALSSPSECGSAIGMEIHAYADRLVEVQRNLHQLMETLET